MRCYAAWGVLCESEVKMPIWMYIADRLYDLVINPELRMRLGKNGRNFVNSFYNWEENVERMETVYENLIKMK